MQVCSACGRDRVANPPCGVETWLLFIIILLLWGELLIHRVELKRLHGVFGVLLQTRC